jgi:hypothetical protein
MLFLLLKVKVVTLLFIGVFCALSTFSVSVNLESYMFDFQQASNLDGNKISVLKESNGIHANKNDILNRISSSEESLQFQYSNLKMYRVIGILIIISLIVFTIISFKRTKKQHFVKKEKLKAKLVKMKTQNQLQEQHLTISRSFHESIDKRFEQIWVSLKNIKTTFEIKDKHLKDEIDGINAFTENTLLEFRQSMNVINKFQ